MDAEAIEKVRRFNRIVTLRVGALDDHYLSRDRPLGEARLLWEIGEHGADVRALRSRLGLDSGYLSRLLRSLESAGLVVVEPSPDDRRVRRAALTDAGRSERAVLDSRSDALAEDLLGGLDASQRDRLVDAMATVTRLLTGAVVEFADVDPEAPAARECLRRYYAELGRRFDQGYDPAGSAVPDTDGFAPPTGTFVVATLWGTPVGCGGLLWTDADTAYLKKMWVADAARGLGIGRRLLDELERRAAEHGRSVVRLETNGTLTEAIALYRSAGYAEVDPFVDEPYADLWFEKTLP